MAKHKISTQITINASADKVWQVLTNFEAYKNWNPFLTHISGDLRIGGRLNIVASGASFQPTVLKIEKEKEFRWLGHLMTKGLFDGEHIFQLETQSDGKIKFIHEELFSGILVGLFRKKLDTDIVEGFQEMNQKLKELAENNL